MPIPVKTLTVIFLPALSYHYLTIISKGNIYYKPLLYIRNKYKNKVSLRENHIYP